MRHTAHTIRSSSMASTGGSSGDAAGDASSKQGREPIDVEAGTAGNEVRPFRCNQPIMLLCLYLPRCYAVNDTFFTSSLQDS